MTHLYDNNLNFLVSLNYEYEDFIKEPSKYYLDWETSFYATQDKYSNPILSDGALREKTREELILIDNKVELLQDGEYIEQGKIIVVPCPEGLLKKKWYSKSHIWKEGATDEELKEYYFNNINTYKAEILEVGFDFNGHQQKCREKDLALLGNAIAAHEDIRVFASDTEDLTTLWAFNDGDTLEMDLTELKKLRLHGAMFVQVVFDVEAQLKSQETNINFTKEEFISLINENSTVKCWE